MCVCVCRGVTCLAHSAAGRGVLLSSGPDGEATSLDTHSGQKLSQFKGSKHGASAAALSEGGVGEQECWWVGVCTGCAELVGADDWTTRHVCKTYKAWMTLGAVAYFLLTPAHGHLCVMLSYCHADGSKLLLGGSTLTLWALDTQQRISRLTGHPVSVMRPTAWARGVCCGVCHTSSRCSAPSCVACVCLQSMAFMPSVPLTMMRSVLNSLCVCVCVLQLPVRALCFSQDASHAISAAVGERLVAVWVVPQQGGKKKAGGVAAASLAVAQPVVQLATAGELSFVLLVRPLQPPSLPQPEAGTCSRTDSVCLRPKG